jgi:hypothetical protein
LPNGPDPFRRHDPLLGPHQVGGLAVVDIPVDHIHVLGGLKQQRARGSLSGAAFASRVMPAGNGRLALSVSKAMMTASHLQVGDDADVEISGVGRD